ncbi:MAG: hypothetical protein HQK79_14720 [Desulfobacterales bacterium]|nr:hypothetical protein [Desulfobacterales bacterium]MBF0397159.1 hypothetical protein [Desulfobacterales bacterium]
MKFTIILILILSLLFIDSSINCEENTEGKNANYKISSNLTPQEVKDLLNIHNKIRADVGVEPLKWSSKIADYAQEWANYLAKTGCKMEHRSTLRQNKKNYGENLFMGTAGHYGVFDAVKSWEEEKKDYKGETLNNSNWYVSGHYTQIVWKATKELGCSKTLCNGKIIVVCNYDPPGNYLGQKAY